MKKNFYFYFKILIKSIGYGFIFTTITVSAAVPPIAPSGLIATGVSATQINLAWTDNS